VIFLTVGTQLPFDRLVSAVDAWSARHSDVPVFGQIGEPGPSGYWPKHFRAEAFLPVDRAHELFERASLVVSHAGMGSIITALTRARPIVVMPRRADLGEMRNDHQLATAERFAARVMVAHDAAELSHYLDAHRANASHAPRPPLGPFAEPRLIEAIRACAMGRIDGFVT
jgi:UDP-N-acetylglucosamine transferase subunit ALG13